MSPRDANTACAGALVDEWARAGVTDAVVAPGSRSTPIALALARDGRVRVQVVLDERSAAFRALGIALATQRPAVVVCTSGTAAANLHPAVIEAHHARVPLLVCTADRPPELRDTGAAQTVDQAHLYGAAVRWYCDPGPPADRPGTGAFWRAIASRAAAAALGRPAGPVHLNLPFREPLVPTGEPLVDAPGRVGDHPWTRSAPAAAAAPGDDVVERLAAIVRSHERGLVVAGWGAEVDAVVARELGRVSGWPLLADAISGLRSGPDVVSTYEALLRAPGFAASHRPDVVVRVGAAPTSRIATEWLDSSIPQVVVDPDDAWIDPMRAASERVVADPTALLRAVVAHLDGARESAWTRSWRAAEAAARAAIDATLDGSTRLFEGRIARDVAAGLPAGANLAVASSLPVRALEWCMAPRAGVRVFSNRGANGIDGFTSTVAGIASVGAGRAVGLCGDLCFLHDTNGLLAPAAPATLVVVDNDGGGIFSYLPQHDLAELEPLFATPHGLDLVAVARAHGARAERVDDPEVLRDLPADGAGWTVWVVPVDRAASVVQHRALWSAVAAAIT